MFNKAIIESDIGKTFYENGRNLLKTALKLGEKLGSQEKDPVKLVEYLKKQSAEEISKQAFSIIEEWTLVRKKIFLSVIVARFGMKIFNLFSYPNN